jgi:hypothetical protein
MKVVRDPSPHDGVNSAIYSGAIGACAQKRLTIPFRER